MEFDSTKKYTCKVCKKPVDREDDLAVSIKDDEREFVEGVTVHRGDCDDILCREVHRMGGSASKNIRIGAFKSDKDLDYFLKNGQRPPGHYNL